VRNNRDVEEKLSRFYFFQDTIKCTRGKNKETLLQLYKVMVVSSLLYRAEQMNASSRDAKSE